MPDKQKPRKGYSVENGVGNHDSNMEFNYEWIKDDKTRERIKKWEEGFDVIQVTEKDKEEGKIKIKVLATIVAKVVEKKVGKNEICIFTGDSVEEIDTRESKQTDICYPVGGTVV